MAKNNPCSCELDSQLARITRLMKTQQPVWTVRDVTIAYGVSRATIYRHIKARKLKAYKIYGSTRFRYSDLESSLVRQIETI